MGIRCKSLCMMVVLPSSRRHMSSRHRDLVSLCGAWLQEDDVDETDTSRACAVFLVSYPQFTLMMG